MRKIQKVLALTGCAALLVVGSVAGTMAYLTAKDDVVNTFTVGQVHIQLDEAAVNEDGEEISGEDRRKANTYKLMPGSTYKKDPTVWVREDSEEAYVRMIVTLDKYSELKELFGDDFLPQYFVDWNSTEWETTGVVTTDINKNTASYEFRYKNTYDATDDGKAPTKDYNERNKLAPLFTYIEFPGKEITNESIATLEGLKINVVAHAIQASNFENADEAWKAFDTQMVPTSDPDTETEAETESE